MTTLHFRKSIGRSLSWRCGFVLVPLALVCFGLSPTAKAQLPAPSPDGGYLGANTAEGHNALHDVNTAVGINNTAVGFNALTPPLVPMRSGRTQSARITSLSVTPRWQVTMASPLVSMALTQLLVALHSRP